MYPKIMGVLLALAIVTFCYSMVLRIRPMLLATGIRECRCDEIFKRIKGMFTFAFGQKRLLFRDGKSGLMHAFIFWGFLVVALRTIILFGQGFVSDFNIPFMNTAFGDVYNLTKNLFEALVLVGVTTLLIRRIFLRPKRLTLSVEADLILILIGILMVTDFMMEWKTETPWYTINYFIHTVGILLFLNYLPYGKHFHIITAIPNVFLRKTKPYGQLRSINLEDESATTFGVEKITEFTWKQYLDLYSCTECGRCYEQCPAAQTDKKLNPKELTIALRNHLYKKLETPLVPQTIDPDVIWDCTTCRACEEACPVFIEYVDKIVDMRRHLVLMKGEFAPEAQNTLRNIENNSNPWGIGFSTRGDWAKDLNIKILSEDANVEYLYFVGCAGSFDERAKKVSRAFVKCLQTAGVSFGILGAEEKCTGDSARRIGNEYLFQMLAKENIATFERYKIKKIITTCPHCYNTIKNEYPQFYGNYEVIHHTELLDKLIKDGKLKPTKSIDKKITFHDSCYLGRYNEIYDAPRSLLKSIPNTHIEEMDLCRDKGRCCGAGGGRMWMEEKSGTRINHKRLEDVKTQTDANLIASSCPFCLTMLSDAVKETNTDNMETKDVAELISESLL